MFIDIDFETISPHSLPDVGLENYLVGADVACYVMRIGGNTLSAGQYDMAIAEHGNMLRHLIAQGVMIRAWNARFERRFWQQVMTPQYNWPVVNENHFIDAAGISAYNGGPLGLDDAAIFWGADKRKNPVGKQLIKILEECGQTGRSLTKGELDKLIEYCTDDVLVLNKLCDIMPAIPAEEYDYMRINERINDHGVCLDKGLISSIPPILEELVADANEAITKATNGVVTKVTQSVRLRNWVETKLETKLESLDRAAIDDLLDSGVPGATRIALKLRRDYGATAATKFKRAGENIADDGRAHGMIIYAGASATARFSSRGLQLHNLVRVKPDLSPERMRTLICKGAGALKLMFAVDEIPTQLSRMTRSMIIAPKGKKLVVADFSSIESMVMPWLAELLGIVVGPYMEAWRDPSRDAYVELASQIVGKRVEDVTSEDRQLGKVKTLACQFTGGKGAMLAMARGYGIAMTEDEAQDHVWSWRQANTWAVLLWDALDQALNLAARGVNDSQTYPVNGSHKVNFLTLQPPYRRHPTLLLTTPAGGRLSYHNVHRANMPDNDGNLSMQLTYAKGNRVAGKLTKSKLYRGIIVENIVQRIARDLLCVTLARCDAAGYSPVAHVHDEIILEVDEDRAEEAKAFLIKAMETPPLWAAGLPTRGEGHIVDRYQKL